MHATGVADFRRSEPMRSSACARAITHFFLRKMVVKSRNNFFGVKPERAEAVMKAD